MSRNKYSSEVKSFIAENAEGRTTRELVKMVNETFGVGLFTEAKMRTYKSYHKNKSGLTSGIKRGSPTKLYPEIVQKYINQNYKGAGPKDMAIQLNKIFGTKYTHSQLKTYYASRKISSGLTGCFEKGHIPPNKGKKGWYAPGCEKGWFKKEHRPLNSKPIGTRVIDRHGYAKIKIDEPNIWKHEHILIWEKANGKIQEGSVLIFRDGNKSNITLENLRMITRRELLELNCKKLRSSNPDLTDTGLLIAKVNIARSEKIKEKRG